MAAMAAREMESVEEDGAVVSAKVAPGSPRAMAFGHAQRHSRRVRLLKFALPLAAAVIAVAFPLYSYLVAPDAVPVQADASAFSDGKLVMAHPKLDGFTKQNQPYSMSAFRAVQDVSNEGVIQLEGIDAKLPFGSGNFAVVKAAHGIYNRGNNMIDLDKDFTVTTTDGMVAKMKSAFLDMGKGNMKTDKPVDITRGGTRILSDTMSVQDHGKVLVFETHVRVNIDPASMKAANDKGGEPNAVK